MPNDSTIWSRVLRWLDWRAFVPQPPLIDRGFGLIYDTERNITWLQDVNYAKTIGRSRDGQLTWPEAIEWVASLSYRGIRGWRLPTALNRDGSGPTVGHNCVGSEMGHLYIDVFQNYPGIVELRNGTPFSIYWTSTEASSEEAYALDLSVLRQGTLWKDPFVDRFASPPLSGPVLAWPVHDGDIGADVRANWLRNLLTFSRSAFSR